MANNNNKKHRYTIYVNGDFQCYCCGLKFDPYGWDKEGLIWNNNVSLEIDHIIPISKGGSDRIENKKPMCSTCNRYKSDLSFNEFFNRIKRLRNDQWKKTNFFLVRTKNSRRRGNISSHKNNLNYLILSRAKYVKLNRVYAGSYKLLR